MASARSSRRWSLFAGDAGGGPSGERGDGDFAKSGIGAPFGEFLAGKAESVAKFDEHVQGHQKCESVGAAGVVDERFDADQGPARG